MIPRLTVLFHYHGLFFARLTRKYILLALLDKARKLAHIVTIISLVPPVTMRTSSPEPSLRGIV